MRRFIFVLQGILPQESVNWNNVTEEHYLLPGKLKLCVKSHETVAPVAC